MARPGPAAVLCLALAVASVAAAASTPPLLPGIARNAGGPNVSVRCLTAAEWAGRRLPTGVATARRGEVVFVTEQACSVLVGYAVAFPYAPAPGSREELKVSATLLRFLAAAVGARHLPRARADCRTLERIVPALLALGVPSKRYAVGVRTRVLVARKRLQLEFAPSKSCSVRLPKR